MTQINQIPKRLLALDPGPVETAWLVYDVDRDKPHHYGFSTNDQLLKRLREFYSPPEELVVEGVACFGMPVGKEVFDTCIFIGRAIEAWHGPHTILYRPDIKLHLCLSRRAKDPNVRQALLDRYGSRREVAIGTKSQPGPLFGISKHVWSALAVAVVRADQLRAAPVDGGAMGLEVGVG